MVSAAYDDEAEADLLAAAGDISGAAVLLERACAALPGTVDRWLKLAAVRRARHDLRGALEAVSGALALDPLNFLPLLMKAGLVEALGQGDAAADLYEAAIFHAPPPDMLPATLRRQLDRARDRHRELFAARERRLIAATAPAERRASAAEIARIARFRSNALRRTQVYHSEPTHFHYPGLVEREFHDRADFPWITSLEAATDAIAADFARVAAAERAELVPYIQYPEDVPLRQWRELNHSRDWTAIHLLQDGRRVEANARHCAATMAAIAPIPQPLVPGKGPNAMFSLLSPGARIPPHHGVANTRLVCHLPLIVPAGCWFRVGAETREWRRGEALVFDDTIEHEAANESADLRVVLIIDVWHPGLAPPERAAVAAVIGESGGDGAL